MKFENYNWNKLFGDLLTNLGVAVMGGTLVTFTITQFQYLYFVVISGILVFVGLILKYKK